MTERTKYQAFEAVEIHRSEIRGAPYNPRSISPTNKRKLKGSLKKHGLVDTLVWNARTGNIVGGHQRIAALDDLEGGQDYKLVVQRIDVDETAEKQLNLALNNKTMQGQFEADLLKDLLAEFVADGVDLEGAGYTATDVQSMYPDIMFAGAMAQADVEADDVATISNMATSGKEHEAEFRARMGLPPTKAMLAEQEQADGESESQGSGLSDQSSEPAETPPSLEHEERGWTKPKDYFQGKRDGVTDRNAPVLSETDCVISLTFQTQEQMFSFMDAKGLSRDSRFFGIVDIEEAFEISLPRKG